ncbi:S8 family peptidase [Kribbella sp. NBC_01505]|uniref:S8 family peptidase n=1 Tax=Kribbella sp. NBC_01505 TaxID=2903580 RepID=UPI003867B0B9
MKRWLAVATAVAVAAGTAGLMKAGGDADAAQDAGTATLARTVSSKDKVVTLITGDRVILLGGDQNKVRIERGPGRESVLFRIRRAGGHLTVLPDDADAKVRSGKLDPRLFDVTTLLAFGYDDANSKSIPLIVEGAQPKSLRMATVRRQLSGAVALSVPKSGAFLQQAGAQKIWLDGKRHVTLDQSVPQIGAPAAWKAGFTGKGVKVAVLDTGIDATHPDFKGQIVGAKNFTADPAGDDFGHGTHVASTIAGTAAASNGRYKGVAPDAKLLDGKVCGSDGGCDESAMLAGMEWAAVDQKAKIINFSIGGPDSPGIDPLEAAVNRLTAQTGALFVIASGNEGEDGGKVDSPGSADAALTVGAVDKQDQFAPFSNSGPRVGDGALKPDVTAPGVNIVAAKAKNSQIGTPVGTQYLALDGTSMATPHVAGAAALLLQQHPTWTAGELKSALMGTAKVLPKQTVFQQGAGRIDVAKAITDTVVADPGSLSFGKALWPEHKPSTKQLTYRNLGTKAVTLTVSASDPVVTVSPTTLTIPAGGTASTSVTADTRHVPDGQYAGRLLATGDGQTIGTPFAVEREVESYDVTVKHLLPNGQGATQTVSGILDVGTGITTPLVSDSQGVAKVRLPKGQYFIDASMTDGTKTYQLVWPALTLSQTTVLVADAKLAKSFRMTLPNKDAKLDSVEVGYVRAGVNGPYTNAVFASDLDQLFVGTLGAPIPAKDMTSYIYSRWGVPGKDGNFTDSPYSYDLMQGVRGRYFTGYHRVVTVKDVATVASQHAADHAGTYVTDVRMGTLPGMTASSLSQNFYYHLPVRTVHYFDAGATWDSDLKESQLAKGAEDPLVDRGSQTVYQRGRSYQERWGSSVAGPALNGWSTRTGNSINTQLNPNSDQDGNPGIAVSSSGVYSTRLFRNGKLVGAETVPSQIDVDNLPAGKSTYRLESTQTVPNMQLSTQLSAVWTFSSANTGKKSVPLPLWGARFKPGVDLNNSVKRTAVTNLPFVVTYQPKAPVGAVKSVQVWVSGDAGKHWTKATVVAKRKGNYVATFKTPAKTIALKSVVTDRAGNTATQTVTNAYRLR